MTDEERAEARARIDAAIAKPFDEDVRLVVNPDVPVEPGKVVRAMYAGMSAPAAADAVRADLGQGIAHTLAAIRCDGEFTGTASGLLL